MSLNVGDISGNLIVDYIVVKKMLTTFFRKIYGFNIFEKTINVKEEGVGVDFII